MIDQQDIITRRMRRINQRKKAIIRRRRIVMFSIVITISAICIIPYYSGQRKSVSRGTIEVTVKNKQSNSNKNVKDIISKFVQQRLYKNNTKIHKNSFDAGKVQDYLSKNIKIKNNRKIAFLTFDDGPSTTVTPRVLNTLKKNNVKATFFIIGKQVQESQRTQKLLRDIYNQGHAIGNHTYTHDYSRLYPNQVVNPRVFMKEIERTNIVLGKTLGKNFATRVIRLPGGHGSWKGTGKLDKQFANKDYKYIDWNSLVGDAERGRRTKQQLIYRYKQTFRGQKKLILLMHDTYGKESTAQALQYIITDLKKKGYKFMVLT
ncbi:polysaccharide deacetylase family protein [Clostridium oryzae]|uniref:Peptidoglycan-N-acetylglucosamine deacetylase n=1 Tax=Clostridium oryzae TaxID=1450648 RepID=A0A1V4IHZ0_9CLOT|nr:polysaccharide deacetylase family protein [Clostridium oryzae]OPJ59285.1 peptidoglycan-N-acetylglucosamine deacetylase [Clostridium oryzae]